MDVITLHQHGFENSIATMGTAITPKAIHKIQSLCPETIMALDADEAGFNAINRIHHLFLEKKLLPKYLNYLPAKDADEFLNSLSSLDLHKRIKEAPTFLDVIIKKTIPDSIPENTEFKLKVLESLFSLLSPLGDHLMAKEKVINASQQIKLKSGQEDIIASYLQFISQANKKTISPSPISQPIQAPTQPDFGHIEKVIGIPKHEKFVLKEILKYPDMLSHDKISKVLDFIGQNEVKRIIRWLTEIIFEIDESEYESFLKSCLQQEDYSEEIKSIIIDSILQYETRKLDKKIIDKLMSDCVQRLQREKLKAEKRDYIERQKKCFTQEEAQEILEKIKELDIKLKQLQ